MTKWLPKTIFLQEVAHGKDIWSAISDVSKRNGIISIWTEVLLRYIESIAYVIYGRDGNAL